MLTRMVSISWPRDPPASASQSAGITGVSQRARPNTGIFDGTFEGIKWNPLWSSYYNGIPTLKLKGYNLRVQREKEVLIEEVGQSPDLSTQKVYAPC